MLDKLLHHKLLTTGLEGEGVITGQKVQGAKGELGVLGFYVRVEGHIRFDDGTQGLFSSGTVDTSKVGDVDVGTIVPVRYDAERKHIVLDTLKLEAKKAARKQEVAEWAEQRRAEDIAAADAALARRDQNGRPGAGSGMR